MDHIGAQKGYTVPFTLPSILDKKKKAGESGCGERDELFEEAARLIATCGLQKARIIEAQRPAPQPFLGERAGPKTAPAPPP